MIAVSKLPEAALLVPSRRWVVLRFGDDTTELPVTITSVETADVVIIGGGIAGLSVADALVRYEPTISVIVVEREPTLTAHSTGRSAAVYVPGLGGPAFSALAAASRRFLEDPPDGFADGPLMTPRGDVNLRVRGATEVEWSDANSIDGEFVELTNREIADLVPWVDLRDVDGGTLQADVLDLDVLGLHQGFVRGARAAGVQLRRTCEAIAGSFDGSAWTITGPEVAVVAPVVVNAAGAWGDVVAERCGVAPVGLRPCRRTAFTVPTPGIDGGPMIMTSNHDFYAKPESGGQLLISPMDQTLVGPCDVRPEEIDIAQAIEAAQRFISAPLRSVSTSWAGLRTFAPDEQPVIGHDPTAQGFVWCCGQGGTGIQTAPAAGALTAAFVLRRAIPDLIVAHGLDPAQIDPARFSTTIGQ